MKIQKIINAFSTYYHRLELKLHKAEVGSHSRFCGHIVFKIEKPCVFVIGDNVTIAGGYAINTLGINRGCCIQINAGGELSIGNSCGLSDVSIWSQKSIKIGNYVTIGAGTIINDSNNHCINYLERRQEKGCKDRNRLSIVHKPIVIGDDVFIGARSIICKGVTIGARSIVAAGSVVVRSIPEDEIWGGNPAVFIKKNSNENN